MLISGINFANAQLSPIIQENLNFDKDLNNFQLSS